MNRRRKHGLSLMAGFSIAMTPSLALADANPILTTAPTAAIPQVANDSKIIFGNGKIKVIMTPLVNGRYNISITGPVDNFTVQQKVMKPAPDATKDTNGGQGDPTLGTSSTNNSDIIFDNEKIQVIMTPLASGLYNVTMIGPVDGVNMQQKNVDLTDEERQYIVKNTNNQAILKTSMLPTTSPDDLTPTGILAPDLKAEPIIDQGIRASGKEGCTPDGEVYHPMTLKTSIVEAIVPVTLRHRIAIAIDVSGFERFGAKPGIAFAKSLLDRARFRVWRISSKRLTQDDDKRSGDTAASKKFGSTAAAVETRFWTEIPLEGDPELSLDNSKVYIFPSHRFIYNHGNVVEQKNNHLAPADNIVVGIYLDTDPTKINSTTADRSNIITSCKDATDPAVSFQRLQTVRELKLVTPLNKNLDPDWVLNIDDGSGLVCPSELNEFFNYSLKAQQVSNAIIGPTVDSLGNPLPTSKLDKRTTWRAVVGLTDTSLEAFVGSHTNAYIGIDAKASEYARDTDAYFNLKYGLERGSGKSTLPTFMNKDTLKRLFLEASFYGNQEFSTETVQITPGLENKYKIRSNLFRLLVAPEVPYQLQPTSMLLEPRLTARFEADCPLRLPINRDISEGLHLQAYYQRWAILSNTQNFPAISNNRYPDRYGISLLFPTIKNQATDSGSFLQVGYVHGVNEANRFERIDTSYEISLVTFNN